MAEIDANVVQVHPAPQHPRALLDQAVEESRKILAWHKVSIAWTSTWKAPDDKPAWFDPHLLGRVLRHLLENVAALHAAGQPRNAEQPATGDRLEFERGGQRARHRSRSICR